MTVNHDLDIDGLEQKLMSIEDVTDVTEFLLDHFFTEEPLGKSINLDVGAEVRPWLAAVVAHQVHENISIVIRNCDSGQLVGVCLNDVEHAVDDAQDHVSIFSSVDEQLHPAMWKITQLLRDLVKDVDLFARFRVDTYVLLQILCVHPHYAGRGLARKMIDATLTLARDAGHALVVSEATSRYSAAAFIKAGFSVENTIEYADYSLDRVEHPFARNTGVHTNARLMIKHLN